MLDNPVATNKRWSWTTKTHANIFPYERKITSLLL